jgi:hypothetical protein
MMMTNEDLIESAEAIIGGDVEELSFDQLLRLITTTQYLTDLCLNEIERRGELTFCDGFVVVPYHCDLMVQTVLTRPPRPEWIEEDPTPRRHIHTHTPSASESRASGDND